MKILRFEYNYRLEFDSDIDHQQFQLRCIPRNGSHQRVLEIDYTIEPVDEVTRLKDGFGNPIYVGSALAPHNHFAFHVKGLVECNNNPISKESECYPVYKYPTSLTQPDQAIKDFANRFDKLGGSEKAIALMHELYNEMTYIPGSTNIYTTASQAFALKSGVCQDYAHIYISMMRYLGYPARYIAGMMLGEGATHAWCEVYVDNHWLKLDPTNNCLVYETYIKLAHGRDYKDCVIDKGMFNGNCVQRQYVSVVVSEEKFISDEE